MKWYSYILSCSAFLKNKHSIPLPTPTPLPDCKDCIHFRPYWMISHIDYELSECALFGQRQSPGSKYFFYNYEAVDCRKDESLCGRNGTFFKPIKAVDMSK